MNETILRFFGPLNKIIIEWKQELIEILLRVGVAIAFIYPAVEATFYPNTWIGFFPLWMRNLPIDNILMLHIFGISEIIIALWILFGKRIFIPSILASGYLFFIILINWRFMDMLFRDIAIFAIPLSLAIISYPWGPNGELLKQN